MKIDEKVTNITSTRQHETVECSIDVTGTAFKNLIINIYAEPYSAILRELTSNARDAHIEAKKQDVPFDLHIPDDSYKFSIRDYGLGLTKEQVMGDFAVAGKSTRQSSNEYIGQKGLGRFAPFTLVDTVSLVSYKDGQEHHFLWSVSQKGGLQIAHIRSKSTHEPNGLKISFECPDANFDITPLFYMDCPINCNVEIPKPNIFIEFPEGFIEHTNRYDTTTIVVMGGVAYHTRAKHSLSAKRIVCKVPIGSVDVTASRDSLENSNKTLATLTQYTNKIINRYKKEAQTIVNNCSSKLEALSKIIEYNSDHIYINHYNGEAISSSIQENYLKFIKTSGGNISRIHNRRFDRIHGSYGETLNTRKILIVDDKYSIRNCVKYLLDKFSIKSVYVFEDISPGRIKEITLRNDFYYVSKIKDKAKEYAKSLRKPSNRTSIDKAKYFNISTYQLGYDIKNHLQITNKNYGTHYAIMDRYSFIRGERSIISDAKNLSIPIPDFVIVRVALEQEIQKTHKSLSQHLYKEIEKKKRAIEVHLKYSALLNTEVGIMINLLVTYGNLSEDSRIQRIYNRLKSSHSKVQTYHSSIKRYANYNFDELSKKIVNKYKGIKTVLYYNRSYKPDKEVLKESIQSLLKYHNLL